MLATLTTGNHTRHIMVDSFEDLENQVVNFVKQPVKMVMNDWDTNRNVQYVSFQPVNPRSSPVICFVEYDPA